MKTTLTLSALAIFTSTAAYSEDLEKLREESRAVVMPFMQKLIAENKKAVSEGGPESAIKVCKEIAPAMSSEVSRMNGLKLTRVSLKVRNPLLGTPDVWEQNALLDFETRVVNGESPEKMEVAEIVQEPGGKYFRYIKAIALQPGCVACHGNIEQISDGVKARLAEEYPHDKATAYNAGQIRGGISIKRPL